MYIIEKVHFVRNSVSTVQSSLGYLLINLSLLFPTVYLNVIEQKLLYIIPVHLYKL